MGVRGTGANDEMNIKLWDSVNERGFKVDLNDVKAYENFLWTALVPTTVASEATEVILSNGKIYLTSDNRYHLHAFPLIARVLRYTDNSQGAENSTTWIAKDNGEL